MPRILIADDNENLRNALSVALSERSGWTVCGQAVNGLSAVSMAARLKPDLIILDFAMPILNGIAATAEILKDQPSVPVVLYTMHLTPQLEREAHKAGVRKVVSKVERFQLFLEGLEEFLPEKVNLPGPLGLSTELPSGAGVTNDPVPDSQPESPQDADATPLA